MTDFAIKVDGVHKNFRLPHEKNTTVKSMFTNMVKLNEKKRTTETQRALQDISFEVKKGEFFGIVGRNGSGKSTLLKILAGIYQPTKGNVYVEGKLVPFIELGVGFNPELSGRDNVYLNGSLLGFSRQEVDEMYDEIVEFAELERFMDQKLKNYSSGMQVRLAFAMAIRSEADILLVDEVLAVGDADFQRKCFDYFKKLKKDKKTVIFVSHDMNAVREYCDKAIMIENSEIIANGSADRIADRYTRMFIEAAKQQSVLPADSNKRWGSKKIEYLGISVEVTPANIIIKMSAKAHENAENPNFGFALRDSTGNILFGSNTFLERKKIEKITTGKEVHIEWASPNILKEGQYSVDPAVVSATGEVWDWWEEAVTFKVFKKQRTPYLIDPPLAVNLRFEDE